MNGWYILETARLSEGHTLRFYTVLETDDIEGTKQLLQASVSVVEGPLESDDVAAERKSELQAAEIDRLRRMGYYKDSGTI